MRDVTQPPQPQIITTPGGLSGTAHAVHALISVLTCGWWLPLYMIIWALSPMKRVQIIAPAGMPPEHVEWYRQQALAMTPEEEIVSRHRKYVALGLILLPFLLWGIVAIGVTSGG